MDNELRVLSSVGDGAQLTQRDIAMQTGLSLGTINILLKKMIREGLIKLETIPPKRLAYMLTPKGMEEKAKKVGSYIQIHYAAIQRMRLQLIELLDPFVLSEDVIVLDINQVELRSIIKQILLEKGIRYIFFHDLLDELPKTIISDNNKPEVLATNCKWINIMNELTVC